MPPLVVISTSKPLSAFAQRKSQLSAQALPRQDEVLFPAEVQETLVASKGPEPQRSERLKRKRSKIFPNKNDASLGEIEQDEPPQSHVPEGAVTSSSGFEMAELDSSDGEDSGFIGSLPPINEDSSFDSSLRLSRSVLAVPSAQYQVLDEALQSIDIRLSHSKNLILHGICDIWVRKGAVSILGAILRASTKIHRVFAPRSHSLPVLRHLLNPFGAFDEPAELRIQSCRPEMLMMSTLSPMFCDLWNMEESARKRPLPKASIERRSFELIDSQPAAVDKSINILELSPDWNPLATLMVEEMSERPNVIFICGPKGSGKSTFARILVNMYLARPSTSNGVAFLDLDLGQPEYSPPGEITLSHLMSYNLGPPFTHPSYLEEAGNRRIRAHHIGAITPREDPQHYIQCAEQLFRQYTSLRTDQSSCSLIINNCGWVMGSGLDIHTSMIERFKPTHVVYMSLDGPDEVVEELRAATDIAGAMFVTATSQPSTAPRRASELRAMQTMSYLHLADPMCGQFRWSAQSLHEVEPLDLTYSGTQQAISGIMIYGEAILPDFLADILNGSMVGLVIVDGERAWTEYGASAVSLEFQHSSDVEKQGDPVIDVVAMREVDPPEVQKHDSSITRTKENLPYLRGITAASIPLDPRWSYTIGQALIRGISIANGTLELLTPVSKSLIEERIAGGGHLLLVRGKLETPGWAYLEGYYDMATTKKTNARHLETDIKSRSSTAHEPQELDLRSWAKTAPWINVASRDKRSGGGIWKVRRNLTRKKTDVLT